MLSETLELDGSAGYDVFDIPWCLIVVFPDIHIVKQLIVSHCQTTLRAQSISLVDMWEIALKKEVFDKGLGIWEALKDAIHETRVSQVLETTATPTGAFTL